MQIFSLISQKGGAGKSTLARQFAVLAGEAGASVLIDRDPQETSTKWWQRRQALQPAPEQGARAVLRRRGWPAQLQRAALDRSTGSRPEAIACPRTANKPRTSASAPIMVPHKSAPLWALRIGRKQQAPGQGRVGPCQAPMRYGVALPTSNAR